MEESEASEPLYTRHGARDNISTESVNLALGSMLYQQVLRLREQQTVLIEQMQQAVSYMTESTQSNDNAATPIPASSSPQHTASETSMRLVADKEDAKKTVGS